MAEAYRQDDVRYMVGDFTAKSVYYDYDYYYYYDYHYY